MLDTSKEEPILLSGIKILLFTSTTKPKKKSEKCKLYNIYRTRKKIQCKILLVSIGPNPYFNNKSLDEMVKFL